MAYNNSPILLASLGAGTVVANAASVAPDASTTTNIVKLVSASGGNPIRVERINAWHAPAAATTAQSANVLRVYIKLGGTTFYLLKELAVAAATRSATVPGNGVEFSRGDGQPFCILNGADELWVSTQVAEPYHWISTHGTM